MDRRLTEFSLGIPEEQRWSTKWRKAVLRTAMKGVLPELIRNRKGKIDFSPIIDQELRQRQSNKLNKLLRFSNLGNLKIVHSDQIFSLAESYQQVATLDYPKILSFQIIVWLELWLRSVFPTEEKETWK